MNHGRGPVIDLDFPSRDRRQCILSDAGLVLEVCGSDHRDVWNLSVVDCRMFVVSKPRPIGMEKARVGQIVHNEKKTEGQSLWLGSSESRRSSTTGW